MVIVHSYVSLPEGINGHFRNPLDWRYVPYISGLFFGVYLCFREYPHKIWPNIWYSTYQPMNSDPESFPLNILGIISIITTLDIYTMYVYIYIYMWQGPLGSISFLPTQGIVYASVYKSRNSLHVYTISAESCNIFLCRSTCAASAFCSKRGCDQQGQTHATLNHGQKSLPLSMVVFSIPAY